MKRVTVVLISIDELRPRKASVGCDRAKEKLYAKLDPETMPPIQINSKKVILDGHHHYRRALKLGMKMMRCYYD